MNNKKLYENSVNVLLDAYNNGKLLHGNCTACAVGNLVADACNISYDFDTEDIFYRPVWSEVFSTDQVIQDFFLPMYKGEAKHQIDSTGYTLDELAKIEYAFESAIGFSEKGYDHWVYHRNIKQGQFIGLVSVLKILKEIHEVKEEIHTENINKLEAIKKQLITV